MEYMSRIDPFSSKAKSYFLSETVPSSVFYELYYNFMNDYSTRCFIIVLWKVFCSWSRSCMRSNGTPEGDQKDYKLFRYIYMYGVFSMALHVLLGVHKIAHEVLDFSLAEANLFVTPLVIITLSMSIFLRTAVLLCVYLKMEFALAGYRYPFDYCEYFLGCFLSYLFLAIGVFAVAYWTRCPFQVIIDLDHFNLLIVSILLLFCVRVLCHDITKFFDLKNRVFHVRVVSMYMLIFGLPHFIFLSLCCMLYFCNLRIYERYSAMVSDVILNFHVVFVFILFFFLKWKFGSKDAPYYDERRERFSNKILSELFMKIWKNFSIPRSLPPESLRTNSLQRADRQWSLNPLRQFQSASSSTQPPRVRSVSRGQPSGVPSGSSGVSSGPSGASSGPSGASSGPSGASSGPSGASSGPSGASSGPSCASSDSSDRKYVYVPFQEFTTMQPVTLVPGVRYRFGSSQTEALSSRGERTSSAANLPTSSNIGVPSDPSNASSDPSGASSDPSGAASDPSGAASDPSGAASDPSGASSDPSCAPSDSSDQEFVYVPFEQFTTMQPVTFIPGFRYRFGPSQTKALSSLGERTSSAANLPTSSNIGVPSDPSGVPSDPSGVSPDPSGAPSDPSDASPDPSDASPNPSGAPSDPSGAPSDPSGASSDPSDPPYVFFNLQPHY